MKDYKKILEGVIYIISTTEKSDIGFANICTYIGEKCPELKESEDEKIVDAIRKALESKIEDLGNGVTRTACLAWLEKQGTPNQTSIWKHWKDGIAGNGEGKPIYLIKIGNTYNISSCLSVECDYIELSELDKLMLEKQGEQKPADKVEPKFNVGDYVVGKYISGYILEVRDDCYLLGYQGFSIDKQDNYHLWTIQDAKDGDILCTPNDNIFIFKTIDGNKILDYCGLYFNRFFSDSGSPNGSSTHYDKCNYRPATKEQRDLLFQKMKEAGYEWDAEKKELRKIDARKNLTLDGDLMQADCMIVEQKHTQEIEPFEAEHGKYYYCIKDYFCGGRKQASKGDVVQALRGLPIMGLKDASEYFLPVNFIKCNSAWSEEDDDDAWMNDIISKVENNLQLNKAEIDWLKNLKQRIGG